MDGTELKAHVLGELRRRLRVPRSYSLLDEDGSRTTVHAAIIESDPLTVSNPANQKTLVAANNGTSLSWLDERDGKQQLLTFAQVRSLAESLTAFQKNMYDFLAKSYGEIGTGVITTPEQIDEEAWPY
jgi:hypothetical protein